MNTTHDTNLLDHTLSDSGLVDAADAFQPLPEDSTGGGSDLSNNIDADHATDSEKLSKAIPKGKNDGDDLKGVLDSIRNFQEELSRNRQEIENHRELLELLGADTWTKKRQADEEAFLSDMRETFEKDPAKAASMMIRKAQDQLWSAFENRLNEEAIQKTTLDRLMDRVSQNPETSSINNFRDEIEFLVRNKGMDPTESIELIGKMASKFNDLNGRKQAAINRMRSESQFESSQHSSRNDPDQEFTRLMSQARSLDEMFSNLRKIRR